MVEEKTPSSRDAILGRVRNIVGEARDEKEIAAEWVALPRAYNTTCSDDRNAVLHRLIDRLHDYDAQVYRVSSEQIAAKVSEISRTLGLTEVLVPAGLDAEWMRQEKPTSEKPDVGHATTPQETAFVEDQGFTPLELDRFTAVLTASTLAIAETGTLLLQNLPGQGRRAATLVPDVHLCVVREADVVATVPEAMRALQATGDLPTTFISGPSATADIEMTRIKGVHGPRFLHVLLVR